jgi:hypothetical protein
LKITLNILLLFVLFQSSAQNLVPNPSFEDTVYCPAGLNDMLSMNNWTAASDGSPDFFHECSATWAGVPNNVFGAQLANTGTAYAGFSVYDLLDTWSYREYLQVQLVSPLQVGQVYYVSLYVSLPGGFIDYGIQEFGFYFSNTELNFPMDTTLNFIPQIENNNGVVTDTVNWTKIEGSFVASGGEQYLVIGNFNNKQNTLAQQTNTTGATYSYYYVDDVCVSNDSLSCLGNVGIKEISQGKKEIIRIVDPMGRETEDRPNTVLIYIYSDGTTEKMFRVE